MVRDEETRILYQLMRL